MNPLLFYPVFLVVVPFLILEGSFRLLPVSSPPHILPVNERDPVARFQPNVEYRFSSDWDFSIVSKKRSNNFGYNFARDYHPDQTTPLLMVIGDSFVEAHAVDAGKSAAEILDSRLSGRGRVYSMGLSGAPLSQYLVFAEYAKTKFRPDALAFVIISNDFDESLLKYKSDPRFHYFDENGNEALLRRIDYELPTTKKLLRRSAFIRYVMLNVSAGKRLEEIRRSLSGRSRPAAAYLGVRDNEPPAALEERLRDSRRAVDLFLDQLPSKSGLPSDAIVFVLDAMRPAIYSEETLRLADHSYHAQMRRYFESAARGRGYHVLDLQPAFIARHRRDNSRFEFPADSHWNELGNRVVAEELERSVLFARVFGRDRRYRLIRW
jgi:hypothetical protein